MIIETPMPVLPPKVFISYSHADRDFVAALASDLAENRIIVWWDEWEIKVGDSLIKKLEDGISGSSYLAIVLSPNSINSAWVLEELKAAMVRQLEEKRTVVLPILLRECQIPPFLKEKRYADFREDYKRGFAELLRSIQPPNTESRGRSNTGQYHNDYAIEWGMFGNLFGLRIEITSHSPELPYAVSCNITAIASKQLSERLKQYDVAGFPWATRAMILIQIGDIISQDQSIILIEGDVEVKQDFQARDPNRGTGVDMRVRARRLGPDPGSDILYEWGSIFVYIAEKHREGIRSSLPPDESKVFEQWCRENPI